MICHIERYFDKGFLLKEEHIRKIFDITRKRLKEKDINEEIRFGVYRNDDLFFEENSVDALLEEENSKRNKIRKIEIKVVAEKLDFSLVFCKQNGASIEIESSDRDFAFLIFSDLKEYLLTEVLVFRLWWKHLENGRFFIFLLPMFVLLWLLFNIITPTSEEKIQAIIASSDISEKINFLIKERENRVPNLNSMKWYLYFFFAIILTSAFWTGIFEKFSFLTCSNIFCFGKESELYEKYCALRSKIVWGVLIGGIVAGLAVNYIWKYVQ